MSDSRDGRAAFGAVVRRRRTATGLTQEELAERTGLSVRAISNIECGRAKQPRRSSVSLLADVLGFDENSPAQPGTGLESPYAPDMAADLVVPRQLPAAVPGFIGRKAELGALDDLLGDLDGQGCKVVVICGMAGVGKTALAVQWAHQVAEEFPDGQLYLDLRGFSPFGVPIEPVEAVSGLLEALGVPAERIPARIEARIGLYRSLLDGKRALVLLDNVTDTDQVRQLLPGDGCVTLVTSRGQLTGLSVAAGARILSLDVLSRAEARDLLAFRLGADRLAAEPQAVEVLVEQATGLPLALSIIAVRASAYPGCRLATLAAQLRGVRTRLEVFDGGEPSADVRTALALSCRRLNQTAARMFRLLGLHPGPEVSIPAAASLIDTDMVAARQALAALTATGLVTEPVPGRFTCHDLVRSYADEQSCARDGDATRRAAYGRMLDYYLQAARMATVIIEAQPGLLPFAPSRPRPTGECLRTPAQARAWLARERDVLLALVREAAQTGSEDRRLTASQALATYLSRTYEEPCQPGTGTYTGLNARQLPGRGLSESRSS